jgi:hypothetical protein
LRRQRASAESCFRTPWDSELVRRNSEAEDCRGASMKEEKLGSEAIS